jgi:hypothetical protein
MLLEEESRVSAGVGNGRGSMSKTTVDVAGDGVAGRDFRLDLRDERDNNIVLRRLCLSPATGDSCVISEGETRENGIELR